MKSNARLLYIVLAKLSVLFATAAFAGSATWNSNPISADWNTAENWTPATVPNGEGDMATFALSSTTDVSLSADTTVDGIVFEAGADAFTVSTVSTQFANVTVSGVGVTNSSQNVQRFVAGVDSAGNPGSISFVNDASAGLRTTFTASGNPIAGRVGGSIIFRDQSTAGRAVLVAMQGVNGGGGRIQFVDSSTGDGAVVKMSGNSLLDLSEHLGGLTIGSLAGSGLVDLGGVNLAIGNNNRDTIFAGKITDGDSGSGSMTKIGNGTLTLRGANTYSGGTIVTGGRLVIENLAGSATGTGAITVIDGGVLGGSGIAAGPVTLGTGNNQFGGIAPGIKTGTPTTLTLNGQLTFKSDSTFTWNMNSDTVTADLVVARGVAIEGGTFYAYDLGNVKLPTGTVLTVIRNTSATRISGAFSDLSDGDSIFFAPHFYGFSASFRGGDGNDLTLTAL